jgi:hypothetical protein
MASASAGNKQREGLTAWRRDASTLRATIEFTLGPGLS